MVASLHRVDEDDVVVVPIDQLDQCSRSQEEVGYAQSVVPMAMAMARMGELCYGVDEH